MKQWLIIAGLLLVLLAGGYLVFSKLIMPKAAEAFIPAKWRNIPLGQKRTVVYEYLGEPVKKGQVTDGWDQHINKSKKYVLLITFGQDSTAKKYGIHYEVEALGYTNVTNLSADSIP